MGKKGREARNLPKRDKPIYAKEEQGIDECTGNQDPVSLDDYIRSADEINKGTDAGNEIYEVATIYDDDGTRVDLHCRFKTKDEAAKCARVISQDPRADMPIFVNYYSGSPRNKDVTVYEYIDDELIVSEMGEE